jgi:hypothetical protein
MGSNQQRARQGGEPALSIEIHLKTLLSRASSEDMQPLGVRAARDVAEPNFGKDLTNQENRGALDRSFPHVSPDIGHRTLVPFSLRAKDH